MASGSDRLDGDASPDDVWRPGRIDRALAVLPLGIILAYRMTLSPVLGRQCRFMPTCSEYGLTAYRRFGARWGAYLTIRRILRCQPFCAGGYDPVPWDYPIARMRARGYTRG